MAHYGVRQTTRKKEVFLSSWELPVQGDVWPLYYRLVTAEQAPPEVQSRTLYVVREGFY